MSKSLLSYFSTEAIVEELEFRQYTVILWSADDVISIRPDLTAPQARTVLRECADTYDHDMGFTWGLVELVADSLFPKAGEAGETDDEEEE